MAVEPIEMTASGIAYAKPCLLHAVQVGGTDSSNDITLTIYDNALAATGKKLLVTHIIDATALGLNGVTLNAAKNAQKGVYVEITTSGTASVICDIEG